MNDRFTIENFQEMFRQSDCTFRNPIICMSLKTKIWWDVFMLLPAKTKFFWTDTRRAYNYAELTPYNKGNLWKIRCFSNGHFDVYFGTVKKAYCTTIQDALKLISK